MVRVPLCDIAWRTLDAQYWGAPQRRRRIFLVADFAAEGRCAAEILFVEQGVSGNLEEGRTSREETAAVAGDGAQASSRGINDAYCLQGSIIGRSEKNGPQGSGINKNVSFTLNTIDHHAVYATQSYSTFKLANKAATLKAQGGVNGGGSENYVAYSFDSLASNSMKSKNPYSGCRQVDVSKTLDTTTPYPSKNQGGIAIFDMTHADEVMRPMRNDKVNTLNSRMGTGGNQVPVLQDKEIRRVRRLTPTECERLQGLPDGYTDIEFKGKPASDARRYKAIGNGMAQPCADFVLQQIVKFQ